MSGLRECVIAWEDAPDSNTWNVLAFDGVIKEQRSGAVQVTQYPVDKGFVVSDHAIRMNRQFQIDSITSGRGSRVSLGDTNLDLDLFDSLDLGSRDTSFATAFNELMLSVATERSGGEPVNSWDTQNQPVTTPVGQYKDAAKWGTAAGETSDYKIDKVAEVINRLNEQGTLIHFTTLRGSYTNCVIKQFQYVNDANTATSLPLSIVIEQLKIVKMKDGEANVQGETGEPEDIYYDEAPPSHIPQSNAVVSTRTTDRNGVDVDLLKQSKITEIPFSRHKPTNFIYNNVNYTLSKFRYNIALERWTTNLRWNTKELGMQEIHGIILTSGVDILAQHNTGLPSLVIVNGDELKFDAQNILFLKMFIVENFKEIFVGP